MKSVTFTRPHKIWNGGEIAGFTADQAKALVDAGVAIYADGPEDPAPVAELTLNLDLENHPAFVEARNAIQTAALEVEAREVAVGARESAATELEARLADLKAGLDSRESSLAAQEADLAARIEAADLREKALNDLAAGHDAASQTGQLDLAPPAPAGGGDESAEKSDAQTSKSKSKGGAEK